MITPIEIASTKHPSAIAYDDGKIRITYADLKSPPSLWEGQTWRPGRPASAGEGSAPKTESALPSLQPGEHIAWHPQNDAQSFLTFWSLQQRGCVACPISDRFPDSVRQEILQRIDAKWLPDLPQKDSQAGVEITTNDRQRPATIILSSGTTGIPKAIVHSLAAHLENAKGAATKIPLGPGDRWLWSLPLYHVSGLSILIRCAVAGATVVGLQADTTLTAGLLHERKITHLAVVATQLLRLMAEDQLFPSPHLKAVLLGVGSVDEALVTAARKRGVAVSTTYGSTEMASQITTSTSADDPATSGCVLPGRELKISPAGEILVRGSSLCLGYYSEGNIESVVDEEGWFHSKDLGTLDDQQRLTVIGRIDNMFISGGENIHPESIEGAMLNLFEVNQVIVVPRADETFGFRPVAFVQGDLPADWETSLRTKLQGYEIPLEVLAWPADVATAIKPDRKKLQQIADRSN